MINALPAYRPPVVETVFCYCRKFYRVYVGCEDYEARFAAREAEQMGAVFVDSRQTPFMTCACGQALDFAPECTVTIQ